MASIHPAIRRSVQFREEIPEDLRGKYPRLHFCPDCDFLLVNDDDPEFEVCTCYYKDGRQWVIETKEEDEPQV
jgi:hypothetical protein